MAIRMIGKNERIHIVVENVELIISRITSSERQNAEERHQKRGRTLDRTIMDTLMKRKIHGYVPKDDPDTWIYDAEGNKVEAEDFNPEMIINWPEPIKVDIYDIMHQNEAGQDIRNLRDEGTDRRGNSENGLQRDITLVD